MKKLILFLLFMSIYSVSSAEIKQHIEFDTTLIYRDWADPPWLFVGTFDFEELPAPLKKTKVDFTLKAVKGDTTEINPQIWKIKLASNENAVEILSDTIFYWPPPHKPGDLFSGTIEFIPLMSGSNAIALDNAEHFNRAVAIERSISFRWIFDDDGILLHLDQYSANIDNWHGPDTYFFIQDSIYIKPWPDEEKDNIFDYDITIKPTPKIGDTSIIVYRLKGNQDIHDGFEMTLGINGMEITKEPDKIESSLSKDQNINPVLYFIPYNVPGNHSIELNIYDSSVPKNSSQDRQRIYLGFIFDEDGNLKYIFDHNMGSPPESKQRNIPKQYLAKNPRVIIIKPGNKIR